MHALSMSIAKSSDMLTIGRVAYRREGADGTAQRVSVIYDCLVVAAPQVLPFLTKMG